MHQLLHLHRSSFPSRFLLTGCLLGTIALLLAGATTAYAQGGSPSPSGNQEFRICPGDSVLITIDTTQVTVPVHHYEWLRNGQTITTSTQTRLFVRDTGSYTVLAYSAAGCSSPLSNTIQVDWKRLVAVNDNYYTDPDTRVTVYYLSNDLAACAPINTHTFRLRSRPLNGILLPSPENGAYIYKPDPGFAGIDSFTYCLKIPGGVQSNIATVTIRVGRVAEAITTTDNQTLIYPNPVENFLYIQGENDNIRQITLIDDRGRRFYQMIPRSEVTVIDMRRYSAAIYIVQVVYRNGQVRYFKILKAE